MENQDLSFADQKIIDVQMEKEVKSAFISYAMSVIMSRALPDVRDGLKPVHRRILYAMYEDGLTHDKPFHKSAATVGNVLGRYHPHGDSAVYDAMVRLAQPFSLRYPLIDGHGNFGNVDGDGAAAYRYTEARMSRLADEMMRDIEKNVVDFDPNFDNSKTEPRVLPSRFPNLLVNGSVGIAVGMATNIPPHNLGEVIDGCIALMENPDITIPELMQYIKGPDFPTNAQICGTNGILEAYTTGRGRIVVRAKAEVEEAKHRIIITEIPYMVNKANLVKAMADCHKDKRIDGLTDIRDESGRAGMRIVVEYRRDANGPLILNQLYAYTQLQDTCAVNMLALVDNIPRILNLKQILELYVRHQEEVIVRRVRFDLEKAKRDAHICEGYKIAIDNIDEVIRIIRASASIPDAKAQLIAAFALSDIQAQAIVDMTLGRLSGLERQKVEDRLARLYEMITEFEEILRSEVKVKEIIRDEMLEIKRRFGDARRTEIVPMENEIVPEDLIERHTCMITLTNAGYMKRQAVSEYTAQHRGGRGTKAMTTKEEDFAEQVISMHSHDLLLLFSNFGKVYLRKAYQIPESSRIAKGTNIVNILGLEEGEQITSMLSLPGFEDGGYLTMVTRQGFVKRTPLSEYENIRRSGKIAILLREGDELLFAAHTTGEDQVLLATAQGMSIRFPETDTTPTGRNTQGVYGIRMDEGDRVVGAAVVDEDKLLVTVSENGYGKRSRMSDYPVQHRAGKGVRCHNVDRTGRVAGIAAVAETEDLLLITSGGIIIRTPVSDIPVYGRATGGVIVMRPTEGSVIVQFAHVATEAEEEEQGKSGDGAEPVTLPAPEEGAIPVEVGDVSDADVTDISDEADDGGDDQE